MEQHDLSAGFERVFRSADRLDADFYRAHYPDLRAFSEAQARAHYAEYGRGEGRTYAPGMSRDRLAEYFPTDRPILEIGPYARPFLTTQNVRYADVFSTEELRARAPINGLAPELCPEIHYNLSRTSLRDVAERFAAAFSSHCIEHQPDLIRHLNDVAHVLEPGAPYVLFVPDKRYCFDHFRPLSTTLDVVAAHIDRRERHDTRTILQGLVLATHNDPRRHWAGDHGSPAGRDDDAWRSAVDTLGGLGGGYVDAHAWQFTAASFAEIIIELCRRDFVRLVPEAIYDTLSNTQEFCAILRRP